MSGNAVPEMRRKLLTVKWGRTICEGAWTRRRPDSPRRRESITLAEAVMTHCETRLADRGYWLHSLCGAAISLGPRSEGKKKHLSAFAFFQQHAKNSSAGTELIIPFDWWCLTHLERFHTGAWFTCTSVLATVPEQSPGLKHPKLLGNSEGDLNFHL